MEDSSGKSIDERLEALTMNLELMSHANEAQDRRIERLTASIEKLVEVSNRDAVDIGALARIAESHEHRPEKEVMDVDVQSMPSSSPSMPVIVAYLEG